jgi:hypothetical protein
MRLSSRIRWTTSPDFGRIDASRSAAACSTRAGASQSLRLRKAPALVRWPCRGVAADRCSSFAALKFTTTASTSDHRWANCGLDSRDRIGEKNRCRNDGRHSIITARPSLAQVTSATTQPTRAVFHARTQKRLRTAQFE